MTDNAEEPVTPVSTEPVDPEVQAIEAYEAKIAEKFGSSEDDGQPSETQSSNTEATETEPEASETQEEAAPELDLSWAPVDIKETFEKLDPEVLATVAPGFKEQHKKMLAAHTKRSQDLAERGRQFEAELTQHKDLIDIGRLVASNPEAQRLFAELISGDLDGGAADSQPLTREDVAKEIQAREAREAREAQSFTQHQVDLKEEISSHQLESGVPKEVYADAFNRLDEALGDEYDIQQIELGGWDKLIKPYLDAAKAEARAKELEAKQSKSTEMARRAASAASPASRSTKPVNHLRPWVSENRPATREEIRELTRKQMSGEDL